MATFEILRGLPAYGPMPEAFSATSHGKHREGFVVRFTTQSSDEWAGNFQPGLGGCSIVFEHPNHVSVIVLSGGQGYIVDPDSRRCLNTFGGDINSAFKIPELGEIVFGNGLWFEAIGRNGHLWRTDRISWDGMKDLVVDGRTLTGQAWDISDQWMSFSLNLTNGEFTGGSYSGPDRRGQ